METSIFFPLHITLGLEAQETPLANAPTVFQTLTTSYASEVAPVALRGCRAASSAYGKPKFSLITLVDLTTWVNACWGIGQLISIVMLRGLLNRTDEWGWRIPYATQVGFFVISCPSCSASARPALNRRANILLMMHVLTVDLASASHRGRPSCPRITLVVRPEGSIGRCPKKSASVDQ